MLSKIWIKIKAKINVAPKGSHAIIVPLILISGLCFVLAAMLAFYGKEYWPFLLTGAGILFFVFISWLLSHRAIDDNTSPPITFSTEDGTQSTSVSVPPGLLLDGDRITNLERVLSMIQHRAPLPNPNGLVDDTGEPIPLSEDEARRRVEAANNQVQQAIVSIFPDASMPVKYEGYAQSKLDHDPELGEVDDVNKPSEEL